MTVEKSLDIYKYYKLSISKKEFFSDLFSILPQFNNHLLANGFLLVLGT